MTRWTADQLDALGRANELRIATERTDGTLRSFVPIWVVRVDDAVYIRAYHGPSGSWYRQALRSGRARIRVPHLETTVTFSSPEPPLAGAIDAAYRAKYGSGMYVDAMVTDDAAAATLQLHPAD